MIFWLTVRNMFYNLWYMFEDLIQVVISFIIVIFIVFMASIICYKRFKKMIYKHKKKHPELYSPKGVYIVSEQKVEK